MGQWTGHSQIKLANIQRSELNAFKCFVKLSSFQLKGVFYSSHLFHYARSHFMSEGADWHNRSVMLHDTMHSWQNLIHYYIAVMLVKVFQSLSTDSIAHINSVLIPYSTTWGFHFLKKLLGFVNRVYVSRSLNVVHSRAPWQERYTQCYTRHMKTMKPCYMDNRTYIVLSHSIIGGELWYKRLFLSLSHKTEVKVLLSLPRLKMWQIQSKVKQANMVLWVKCHWHTEFNTL